MLHLVRQSVRVRAFRTIVIITCIAILVATLFSGTLVMEGVNRSVDVTQRRLGADLLVVPGGAQAAYEQAIITGKFQSEQTLLTGTPFGFYMDRDVEDLVAKIPGVVQTTPQLFTATLPGSTCPYCFLPNIFIIGFDPKTDFTITPWLNIHVGRPLGPDEVVTGTYLNVPKLGYKFKIFGYEITVAGILEPTGTGVDDSVFMPIETVYTMAEEAPFRTGGVHQLSIKRGQISAVLIRKDPKVPYAEIALTIYTRAKSAGIKVDVIEATQLGRQVREKMTNVIAGISMAVGVLWGLSLLFISSIFMLSVNERRREIGLLRAMGATRNFVFSMIMSEAVLLTIFGGITGIIVGAAALHFFRDLIISPLGVPYIWPSMVETVKLVSLGLGLSVATGAAAAFYPASLAGRMEPYESVRKEW